MTAINWSNVTDFSEFPGLANTATDGLFWGGMLQMVWIIILLLGIVCVFSKTPVVLLYIL